MITAVAFDLWETLITEDGERAHAQTRLRLTRLERILAERGFGATAEAIENAYRDLWRRCHELYWINDRDVPCRRQIELFLESLALDGASFDEPALDALEEAYAMAAVELPPSLVDGASDVLRDLKSRGLLLGLISNTGRTPGYALRRVLEANGIGGLLDAMVFSNEHGHCKPVPSIFEELRRGLGVAYEEIVFVGDNLYVDVHGAQRCGMRAVHFVPPVRGSAVAPPVEHDLTILPDATISDLRELPELVAGILAAPRRV
jgi:putative hydrolase of the HAD superfamily